MSESAPESSLLAELALLSADLARDPLLVQAGGGNTSVKDDDVMWVKASGCWLADADSKPIFVPIDKEGRIVKGLMHDPQLRPSIETALHLAMPHRFVVHLHAANSAAISVLKDGAERFRQGMRGGPPSLFLPYAKPGDPLAKSLVAAMARQPETQVVLLQNHGLVVGGASADEAHDLIMEVERRLAPASLWQNAALPLCECPDGYEAIAGGQIFLDEPRLLPLLNEPCFPDQVVFLAGQLAMLPADMVPAGRVDGPAMLLIEGGGLFVRTDIDAARKAILAWLIEIARRMPPHAGLVRLTPAAAADLLGWEAEDHRRKMAFART